MRREGGTVKTRLGCQCGSPCPTILLTPKSSANHPPLPSHVHKHSAQNRPPSSCPRQIATTRRTQHVDSQGRRPPGAAAHQRSVHKQLDLQAVPPVYTSAICVHVCVCERATELHLHASRTPHAPPTAAVQVAAAQRYRCAASQQPGAQHSAGSCMSRGSSPAAAHSASSPPFAAPGGCGPAACLPRFLPLSAWGAAAWLQAAPLSPGWHAESLPPRAGWQASWQQLVAIPRHRPAPAPAAAAGGCPAAMKQNLAAHCRYQAAAVPQPAGAALAGQAGGACRLPPLLVCCLLPQLPRAVLPCVLLGPAFAVVASLLPVACPHCRRQSA